VQRFRGGLVLKAHKLCVSLNSRLGSNKEEERRGWGVPAPGEVGHEMNIDLEARLLQQPANAKIFKSEGGLLKA